MEVPFIERNFQRTREIVRMNGVCILIYPVGDEKVLKSDVPLPK